MRNRTTPAILIALLANTTQAEVTGELYGVDYTVSGFASIVAGGILEGSRQMPLSKQPAIGCPCYVNDWSNGGWYGKHLSLEPESRLGIQGNLKLTDSVSATAQLTTRGSQPEPNLQWAYLTWRKGNFELQAGRKRIPLYFYSTFQDVGLTYPWISPPSELYGWEATNYNGANLRWRGEV